jgi:hypothetical protein
MATATIRVSGLREFQRALARGDKETRKQVRAVLRKSGEAVRAEATSLFTRVDADSAAGYRVVVRQRGVSVEQSRRRTTGKHPQYGALQMRIALLPAVVTKETETVGLFEKALDDIADVIERG